MFEIFGVLADFFAVAVVHAQDTGASLRLDADGGEREVDAVTAGVEGLRVVIEQEQLLCFAIRAFRHFGKRAQPVFGKVVAFIDEDGAVLAAGDGAVVDSGTNGFGEILAIWGFEVVLRFQLAAPVMEIANFHVFQTVQARFEQAGEHDVVADDEDGFAGIFCGKPAGTVLQDDGFAGTGHAVDNAVAVAQFARKAFLGLIHDFDGFDAVGVGFEEFALGIDDVFGIDVRTYTATFFVAEVYREFVWQHAVQFGKKFAATEGVFEDVFFVPGEMRREAAFIDFAGSIIDTAALPVAHHRTKTPGEAQFALVFAIWLAQPAIRLHVVNDGKATVARLLDGMGIGFRVFQCHAVFVHGSDVAHMPVLDFQTPQAMPGVENEEIRIAALFAMTGNVVPDEVVVIEIVAKELGEAFFADHHFAFFQRGEDLCHRESLCGRLIGLRGAYFTHLRFTLHKCFYLAIFPVRRWAQASGTITSSIERRSE